MDKREEYLKNTIEKANKENPELVKKLKNLSKVEDIFDWKKYQKRCDREVR